MLIQIGCSSIKLYKPQYLSSFDLMKRQKSWIKLYGMSSQRISHWKCGKVHHRDNLQWCSPKNSMRWGWLLFEHGDGGFRLSYLSGGNRCKIIYTQIYLSIVVDWWTCYDIHSVWWRNRKQCARDSRENPHHSLKLTPITKSSTYTICCR